MKFKRIAQLKHVEAIIEYGSYARGDNDPNSDYDLFILVNGEVPNFLDDEWKEYISMETKTDRFDISVYDRNTFELMLEHGSLFLWHLKFEGKVIYSSRPEESLFYDLEEFTGADENLYLYRRMLRSVNESIKLNGSNNYDLNILSLLARNILIITCYKIGNMQFGKKQVFEIVEKYLGSEMPLKHETYSMLLNYRLFYSRNISPLYVINNNQVWDSFIQVENLLNKSFDVAGLRNSLDRVVSIINKKIDRDLYSSYEILTEFERDLYIGMVKISKNKLGVVINGLSKEHEIVFSSVITKDMDSNFVELVCKGFEIYNELQLVKQKTSSYGPDSANIFGRNSLEDVDIEEFILERLFNNFIINKSKLKNNIIYRYFIKPIEDKLIEDKNEKNSLSRFIKKVNDFSDALSKYH